MTDEKNDFKLTEGSIYRITSLGGRQNPLESTGSFKGYASIGLEDSGIQLELDESHGEDSGRIRVLPLHVILAIDVIEEGDSDEESEETKEISHHYYG